MNITENLLTVNPYSRPGRKLSKTLGLIFHWTGVPLQPAIVVRQYFDMRQDGKNGYGSAHYVIDIDGSVIHMIPDDEVAYHVGSSDPDPESGKIYTDWARAKFGAFASNPTFNSPNNCTIGVEMVPTNDEGQFTTATIGSARDVAVSILRANGLDVEDIGTHHLVIGFNGTSHQDCPRWWTNHPDDFEHFKSTVQRELLGGVV